MSFFLKLPLQAWRKLTSPTAADCLIATVAIRHNVVLLHCDADFEAMKEALPLKTLDWTFHLSAR